MSEELDKGSLVVGDTHVARLGRLMVAPAVGVLLVAMIVPLAITLYYSVRDFRLLEPGGGFVGIGNYVNFVSNPMFVAAVVNTLLLVCGVLLVTIVLGIALALLLDQPVKGIAGLRMLIISPFFVMPTVSALVWKNLLMNPVSGLFAAILTGFGLEPVDWLGAVPLASIIAIVSWEWLPFATLIFLTSLQSLDREQMEAAELDGAKFPSVLRWLILPHLARPIAIVVLMETIFLLAVFAEIYVTTGGGPGDATTNLSFLIFAQALLRFDIGAASAGGIVAVIIANSLALLMVRIVGKSIEE